ncbi:hypothetical protein [Streptomyces fradiae]
MIHPADIREWRNQDVVDPAGHKIGVLEAVYVHTATGEVGEGHAKGPA